MTSFRELAAKWRKTSTEQHDDSCPCGSCNQLRDDADELDRLCDEMEAKLESAFVSHIMIRAVGAPSKVTDVERIRTEIIGQRDSSLKG